MMTLQEQASVLFEEQKQTWPLLGSNWALLDKVQVREFPFDGYVIRVQHNPGRIISSAAKVDKASIEQRSCFLCPGNRPPEELGVWFGEDYEILCNPFPIFRQHFTIAHRVHTPQVIRPEITSFLELARELPSLVVFYNAPACGASAPDHLHFQAGNRGLMPIEGELDALKNRYGSRLHGSDSLTVNGIADGLRNFFLLESGDRGTLENAFYLIFDHMEEYQAAEPMLNLLAWFDRSWKLLLFPREKHRPWQYFEEGDRNILLSPAAVDMGGTLITPLEKDFNAITGEAITDIFSQVTCSSAHFQQISRLIQTKLNDHAV